MKKSTIVYLGKTTVQEWLDDKALRLGAALSYYTVFSLAPILVIVIAIAGLAFGNDVARTRITGELQGLLGQESSQAIGEMLQSANKPKEGTIATILGFLALLFGATGVVTQLKDALNTIWEVEEKKEGGGIRGFIKDRMMSLAMILAIGFLLLVSLVVSAGLTAISERFGTAFVLQILNFIVSIGVITVLFALIFKYLPDAEVKWRNVWIGAFVTAVLFAIGKTVTALYIAESSVASGYGAAGSLVIILIWVYYNSQILFLGAEFTQVYSSLRGDQKPIPIDEEDAAARIQRQQAEEDLNQEEKEMTQTEVIRKPDQSTSPLYKFAYRAGYQMEKLEHSKIKKNLKITKWAYRVVKLLGVKTSAKLGWKGFKIKRKINKFKKDEAA